VTAPRFRQIADLSELPRLVESIGKAG
ncbi:MAG: HAD family hydrolase, partial [Mesorhizobium sp.]